jgi:hypothetical protein
MLDLSFNFDPVESEALYNLSLRRDDKWRETPVRVLIIAQTVDRREGRRRDVG